MSQLKRRIYSNAFMYANIYECDGIKKKSFYNILIYINKLIKFIFF